MLVLVAAAQVRVLSQLTEAHTWEGRVVLCVNRTPAELLFWGCVFLWGAHTPVLLGESSICDPGGPRNPGLHASPCGWKWTHLVKEDRYLSQHFLRHP